MAERLATRILVALALCLAAKFAEEADQSRAAINGTIKQLEETTDVLVEDVAAANLTIERLQDRYRETKDVRR